MKSSSALSCPSCAGPLSLLDGEIRGRCRHCGVPVRINGGVERDIMQSSLDGTGALRAVRGMLCDRNARRGALARAKVGRPRLFYVPFWHVSAQICGFASGLDPVWEEQEIPVAADTESSGDKMSSTGATRTVRFRKGADSAFREIAFRSSLNMSAADLEPLGIPTLDEDAQHSIDGLGIQRTTLPEGLEPLDRKPACEGIVVDPSVPLSQALAGADRYFSRLADGASRGLEQRWSSYAITGRRVRLIFYPLWIVDFDCDGSRYRVILDGASGRAVRGILPGRRRDLNVLAAVLASLWALYLPLLLALAAGDGPMGGTAAGFAQCLPGILAVSAVAAAGTWRLVGMLDSISGKGSDVVV